MPRRSRKSSPLKPLLMWGCAVAFAGWGIWQADQIWHAVAAEGEAAQRASQPAERAQVVPVKDADAREGESPLAVTIDGVNFDLIVPADEDRLEPAEPEFDPALTSEDLRSMGMRLLATGEDVAARDALNAALGRCRDDTVAESLRTTLRGLNTPVFLGTAILPEDPAARLVEIQPGDSFTRLGHEYAVPASLLEAINPSLKARDLRPLKGMKIVEGPFHARVIKHASRLDLYARRMYVTSWSLQFPEGNILPAGEYRIAEDGKIRLANGKTWIGFEGADAGTDGIRAGWIFGSTGPRGTASRDRETGIRMADSDLASLYNVLVERRSLVRVER